MTDDPLRKAKEELAQEKFREQVNAHKRRLRKPFWKRLFNKRLVIKLEDATDE